MEWKEEEKPFRLLIRYRGKGNLRRRVRVIFSRSSSCTSAGRS